MRLSRLRSVVTSRSSHSSKVFNHEKYCYERQLLTGEIQLVTEQLAQANNRLYKFHKRGVYRGRPKCIRNELSENEVRELKATIRTTESKLADANEQFYQNELLRVRHIELGDCRDMKKHVLGDGNWSAIVGSKKKQ